jgi:hypothetical protein
MQRFRLFQSKTEPVEPAPAKRISLYPSSDDLAPLDNSSRDDELNDLSYEDALLDTEARLFFMSEAKRSEVPDPSASFAKLLARIESPAPVATPREVVTPQFARKPGLAQALRGVVTGTAASKLMPAGVALLLLVTVLGPSIAQRVLPQDPVQANLFTDGAPAIESPVAPRTDEDPSLVPGPERTYPDYDRLLGLEAPKLHPVELGMKPQERALWERLHPEYFGQYKRTKFGPE